ncbi:hypothetical protein INT47_009871 [Mucor saturninus]|uniref:3-oxo-5-alpha-steroid 4-dehydrogenase C-terminal domain-containing protein n=1 Tax=Mucor saturninus TaxID=64648 RepID=A0A8H7UYT8_9FUNG|nr:hypothetical protein INT47_009871 [Mucor saturninus]
MNVVSQYWLKTTTYNTAVGIYATLPFIMAPALLFVNAPYGRFAGKFGIDCSLSGKWGWFIMEFVSPVMFATSVIIARPTWTPFQIILTSAWLIHYINRSIIYPLRATSMAPLHVLAFVCSIAFNMFNGYTNGMWVARHSQSIYEYKFWAGMSLWVMGLVSNIYHDTLLFKLRKKTMTGKKRYAIPHGGLFEYVSCPNYFSETMEWMGFAIATAYSVPAYIFVAATVSNLFPRAIRTHEWYKNEFKNYPKSRKAVIPYIY